MDADSPVLAADRRAGLVKLVVAALTTAVAIRGITWLATFFIFGPVLGPASFGLAGTSLGKDAPAVLEGFLLLAAITVSVLIAVGLHRDEEQWLGRARRFGWLLVYDTVFYVGSAVVAVVVWGGLDNLRDQAPGLLVLAVVNVPIAWLGRRVARRAHS
jgi:hypothetical protein